MKIKQLLFTALALCAAATAFAEMPRWLTEQVISREVNLSFEGRDDRGPGHGPGRGWQNLVDVKQTLALPGSVRLSDVIVTAASAMGQGRIDLLMDNRPLTSIQVDRKLRALTIPANIVLMPYTSLQLYVSGNVYIATLAATIERTGYDPVPPGPVPPGPVPPGPVPPGPVPPPVDPDRVCNDFAFEAYKSDGYNNMSSLNLAKSYCTNAARLFVDLRVFRKIFDIYKGEGYNGSGSLNLSKSYLDTNLELVRSREYSFDWFFGQYKADGYNGVSSLNLTKSALDNTPEQLMSCLTRTVDLYLKDGYSHANSINMARSFCRH